MTEQEWLECTDPQKMLDFLRGTASSRKLRLFVVAAYQRYFSFLPMIYQQAIAASEKYADAMISQVELNEQRQLIEQDIDKISRRKYRALPHSKTMQLLFMRQSVLQVASPMIGNVNEATRIIFTWGRSNHEREQKRTSERLARCDLLHCIFGNPFRPVAVDPGWLTPDVAALAQAIYDERRFADLPILADALEEAGCTSDDILDHCRAGGDHTRGCWVVDLLLGKG